MVNYFRENLNIYEYRKEIDEDKRKSRRTNRIKISKTIPTIL